MRILFLHGAGGYVEDRSMADGLGAALEVPVEYLRLPAEELSVEAWSKPIGARVAALGSQDLVIAHSFAASMLLHVLGTGDITPTRAILLAMPNWGLDGWQVAEYDYQGPEPTTALALHHCRDDEVVPFDHLALNAGVLPSASVHEHSRGGHQFDALLQTIAAGPMLTG
jgi:predicted alpha/beta hydrolase family esterase